MNNPEETDTELTDSRGGMVKDSTCSSETTSHVSVPALRSLWLSVLRKMKNETESKDYTEENRFVEVAKEGEGS